MGEGEEHIHMIACFGVDYFSNQFYAQLRFFVRYDFGILITKEA